MWPLNRCTWIIYTPFSNMSCVWDPKQSISPSWKSTLICIFNQDGIHLEIQVPPSPRQEIKVIIIIMQINVFICVGQRHQRYLLNTVQSYSCFWSEYFHKERYQPHPRDEGMDFQGYMILFWKHATRMPPMVSSSSGSVSQSRIQLTPAVDRGFSKIFWNKNPSVVKQF